MFTTGQHFKYSSKYSVILLRNSLDNVTKLTLPKMSNIWLQYTYVQHNRLANNCWSIAVGRLHIKNFSAMTDKKETSSCQKYQLSNT